MGWQVRRDNPKPVKHGREQRPNARQRGYDYRWEQARAAFLAANPLCKHCRAKGLIQPATVVDHIQPHRGDQVLFWLVSNWQPLCETCHNRKTAKGL